MRNDHSLPGRRSIRLSEHDYTDQGPYFLTITANQRASLFGHIVDGEMCRNWLGQIVMEEWRRSAEIRPEFWFDAFVVMPNHIQAIVAIAPPILEPTLE
jgi:REP element-mobilizing transposase RayT